MERFNADYLFRLGRYLTEFTSVHARIGDRPTTEEMRHELRDAAEVLRERLEPYGLTFTIQLLDRMVLTIDDGTPLSGTDLEVVVRYRLGAEERASPPATRPAGAYRPGASASAPQHSRSSDSTPRHGAQAVSTPQPLAESPSPCCEARCAITG